MSAKCWCGQPLRADGFCRSRCDPALKPSELRKARVEARRKAHAARVESERVHLTAEEERGLNRKLAAVDPLYAHGHRIAQKAGIKGTRSRWGK